MNQLSLCSRKTQNMYWLRLNYFLWEHPQKMMKHAESSLTVFVLLCKSHARLLLQLPIRATLDPHLISDSGLIEAAVWTAIFPLTLFSERARKKPDNSHFSLNPSTPRLSGGPLCFKPQKLLSHALERWCMWADGKKKNKRCSKKTNTVRTGSKKCTLTVLAHMQSWEH